MKMNFIKYNNKTWQQAISVYELCWATNIETLLLFHKIFASGLKGNVSIITPHSIVKLYKSATSGIQSYVRSYGRCFAKLTKLCTKLCTELCTEFAKHKKLSSYYPLFCVFHEFLLLDLEWSFWYNLIKKETRIYWYDLWPIICSICLDLWQNRILMDDFQFHVFEIHLVKWTKMK